MTTTESPYKPKYDKVAKALGMETEELMTKLHTEVAGNFAAHREYWDELIPIVRKALREHPGKDGEMDPIELARCIHAFKTMGALALAETIMAQLTREAKQT